MKLDKSQIGIIATLIVIGIIYMCLIFVGKIHEIDSGYDGGVIEGLLGAGKKITLDAKLESVKDRLVSVQDDGDVKYYKYYEEVEAPKNDMEIDGRMGKHVARTNFADVYKLDKETMVVAVVSGQPYYNLPKYVDAPEMEEQVTATGTIRVPTGRTIQKQVGKKHMIVHEATTTKAKFDKSFEVSPILSWLGILPAYASATTTTTGSEDGYTQNLENPGSWATVIVGDGSGTGDAKINPYSREYSDGVDKFLARKGIINFNTSDLSNSLGITNSDIHNATIRLWKSAASNLEDDDAQAYNVIVESNPADPTTIAVANHGTVVNNARLSAKVDLNTTYDYYEYYPLLASGTADIIVDDYSTFAIVEGHVHEEVSIADNSLNTTTYNDESTATVAHRPHLLIYYRITDDNCKYIDFDSNDGFTIADNDLSANFPGKGDDGHTGDRTVWAWLKADSLATQYFWVKYQGGGDSEQYWGVNGSGEVWGSWHDTSDAHCRFYTDNGSLFSAGEWFHLSFGIDASAKVGVVYVNGVSEPTTTTITSCSGNVGGTSAPLAIGDNVNADWVGEMDTYAVFSDLPTQEEVLAYYKTDCQTITTHMDNVESCWDFNDRNGDDYTANGNDLSETGTPAYLDTDLPYGTCLATSTNCYSYDFDKTTPDYLYVADTADLDVGNADFTLESWVKPETSTVYMWVSGKRRNGSYAGYQIFQKSTNNFEIYMSDSSNTCIITTTASVADGAWGHVAVVMDGTTLRSYVNGIADNTTSCASVGSLDNANEFAVGIRTYDHNNPYDGLIDDVRLWKTARSPEEIWAFYRQSLTGVEEDLEGNWNFDAQDLTDISGNGNTLTSSGSPTASSDFPYGECVAEESATPVFPFPRLIMFN